MFLCQPVHPACLCPSPRQACPSVCSSQFGIICKFDGAVLNHLFQVTGQGVGQDSSWYRAMPQCTCCSLLVVSVPLTANLQAWLSQQVFTYPAVHLSRLWSSSLVTRGSVERHDYKKVHLKIMLWDEQTAFLGLDSVNPLNMRMFRQELLPSRHTELGCFL